MGTEDTTIKPEEARDFVYHLYAGIRERLDQMHRSNFTDNVNQPLPIDEKGKQYYGKDVFLLLSGIEAALVKWEPSGNDVQELKENYSGAFVEGVEIGERLAVYEDRDFTFTK